MKLFFALLVMAAAAAADDDGDANANGAQNYDVYNGDNGNANAEQSWGSWFDRDHNFYRSGFVNPALNNPLYHNSAQSVLENLSDFKALYVKYENCAWAQYGQEYAERRGEDGEWDGGDGDGATQILGCGAARGGDEHWYMGRTPCFRAQAAFSLYGIHKDHIGSIGSKCHHATFINSFFTTLGVEALAAPLGVDTTYGNSYCTVYPPSDGSITYDDDANAQDHHDEMYNFEAFTSAGTGCQRKRFVKDTYGGAFCNGNDKLETTDTLDSFNKALDKLDCVQIYDSSSGYYYENDGNQEDNPEDNQGAVDFTALDNSVEILKYSIACDVDQYPGSCPDPHGLLRKYSAKLKKALTKADRMNKKPGEIAMNALTGVLLFVSLLLGMTTIRKRRRMASKKARLQNSRKKNQNATPPPSSADNASIISSSTTASSVAFSAASSVHSSLERLRKLANASVISSSTASSVASSATSSVHSALEKLRKLADQAKEDADKETTRNENAEVDNADKKATNGSVEVDEETPYQAQNDVTSTSASGTSKMSKKILHKGLGRFRKPK